MSVREYIGARYVPLFAEPIDWDITKTYEPLTIVLYQGNSYTSRQHVPAGIEITDTRYWVETGNYNAQVEAYRNEVLHYVGTMDGISDTVDNVVAEIGTGFDSQNTIADAIEDEETARIAADSALQQEITSRTNDSTIVWIGDSWGVYNDGELPSNVAKGLNATLKNYSVNGVGFIYGSSNFTAQVNQAVNDQTITNPDAVKYVVLYGLSNDFTHNYTTASAYVTAISAMVETIKETFENAIVHIFFNNRWRFGETVYPYQNPQIKLANNIFNALTVANVDAVIHPDSIAWLGKDSFAADLIHPIDTFGYSYLTQFVLTSIVGGTVDAFYTNVQSILLGNGVTGRLTVLYSNRQITVEAYVVLDDTMESAAIVARGEGLFPVELFENAAVGQSSNQLCISLGKAEGRGELKMPIQFNANSSNEDLVYVLPTLTTDSASAGTYWGSITFRMF